MHKVMICKTNLSRCMKKIKNLINKSMEVGNYNQMEQLQERLSKNQVLRKIQFHNMMRDNRKVQLQINLKKNSGKIWKKKTENKLK